MNKTAQYTKGPCEAKQKPGHPWRVETKDGTTMVCHVFGTRMSKDGTIMVCHVFGTRMSKTKEEQEANAHLIAEAFNVAHETGLTPRQLAEQRAELLEALKLLAAQEDWAGEVVSPASPVGKAWALIAEAEGRK